MGFSCKQSTYNLHKSVSADEEGEEQEKELGDGDEQPATLNQISEEREDNLPAEDVAAQDVGDNLGIAGVQYVTVLKTHFETGVIAGFRWCVTIFAGVVETAEGLEESGIGEAELVGDAINLSLSSSRSDSDSSSDESDTEEEEKAQ